MTLGSPAVVIVPKAAEPTVAFGAPNGGVLVALNASARTSSAWLAEIGTRRINARSRLRKPGPRTGLRELVPIVNAGAAWKAAVLNQRLTDRSSEDSSGSPITFGRWVPNPAKALLLVV